MKNYSFIRNITAGILLGGIAAFGFSACENPISDDLELVFDTDFVALLPLFR
jgi:hypothetical protein